MSQEGTSGSVGSRSVLVAGSTGLVGRALVERLSHESDVSRIVLPVRRPLPHGALSAGAARRARAEEVDFGRLENHAALFRVDQVFICLGTTLKQAGSRAAFRQVDHDYVVAVAEAGARGGARDLLMVSSLGANPRSRFFYTRVKGEVEEALAALPYRSVTFFRPSLLLGERPEPRPGERAGAWLASTLGPLLRGPLARYRPVKAFEVAAAMAAVAGAPGAGVRVVESEQIPPLVAGR